MAIYHLHVKPISRGKGRNVIAAAAYRRATRMVDEREGRTYNYCNKMAVIHSELAIPNDPPSWLQALLENENGHHSAEVLWNLVEKTEKRIDARLAREIEFALPIELTQAQNIELAREFIEDQFINMGMIADWSVHYDDGNPHVHVLLTTRVINPTGFGNKVRSWNANELVLTWRLKWAEYVNYYLALHQHGIRIDHRSYADQGIELIPTQHQGKAVEEMQARGIKPTRFREAENIKQANVEKINHKPHLLLNKLATTLPVFTDSDILQENLRYSPLSRTQIRTILSKLEEHQSVFTDALLAKEIFADIQNTDAFIAALTQLKQSSELIHLGLGEDGRERYTTRSMFTLENTIQDRVDALVERSHFSLGKNQFQHYLARYEQQRQTTLLDEQRSALAHLVKGISISCLVGIAGSGKSFLLGAAREMWQNQGVRVQGIALAGIAAKGLEQGAGIPSQTIASFLLAVESNPELIQKNDVIVMDEAGMCDSISMEKILTHVSRSGAKMVLVGDPAQLQPVGPGAAFRAILERVGFAEINTVYRQKETWQRQATLAFSMGHTQEALSLYQDRFCLHLSVNEEEAMTKLVNDWLNRRQQLCDPHSSLANYLVIAHRNKDVIALNHKLRALLLDHGELGCELTLATASLNLSIAVNERLLFLKNSTTLGIQNGQFATVTHLHFTESGRVTRFEVRLDGSDRILTIDPAHYSDFTYGYCATLHKTQGITVDHTFVYAGGNGWNRALTYVAMTRHRFSCALYAAASTYSNLDILKKNLSRFSLKDSVLDYPYHFAKRRGIDATTASNTIRNQLATRLNQMKSYIESLISPEKVVEKQQCVIKENAIVLRRQQATLVAESVDWKIAATRGWWLLKEKMDALGDVKKADVYELIQPTADYQQWLTAIKIRNEKAALIHQDIEHYQTALDFYHFEASLIQAYAKEHEAHQRVKHYLHYCATDQTDARDELAYSILSHIKLHYPYLKEHSINTQLIKAEARLHVARQYELACNETELPAFRRVRAYHEWNHKIKVSYAVRFQHEDSQGQDSRYPTRYNRTDLPTLRQDESQRNKLAKDILLNLSVHEKALDFYKIGSIRNRHTTEEKKQAAKNWHALQSHAAHFEREQAISRYLILFNTCQLNHERLQLAHHLMQQPRFYAPLLATTLTPSLKMRVWQAIKQDARRYELQVVRRSLNVGGHDSFDRAAAYHQLKKAASVASGEVFSYQKMHGMSSIPAQINSYADAYSEERNLLAAAILENDAVHEGYMTHFGLPKAELDPNVYTNHCQQTVGAYLNANSKQERARIALQIPSDIKPHYPYLLKANINWKTINVDGVYVAMPTKPEHCHQFDFNDALLQKEVLAVTSDLDKAILQYKAVTNENLIIDLKATMAALPSLVELNKSIPRVADHLSDELLSLNTLLTRFMDMELAQESNLIAVHLLKEAELKQVARDKVIAQSEAIQELACTLLQHLELNTELKEVTVEHATSIAKLGGYQAMRERLQAGSFTGQDKVATLLQVRQRAQSYQHSISQKQNRSRTY